MSLTHKDLAQRLDELEHNFINYSKETSADIDKIFQQLRYLTDKSKPGRIGFKTED